MSRITPSHIRATLLAMGFLGTWPALGLVGGCGDAIANQTASLGRSVAGQRGRLKIIFINNTPHRAVFSYGTFDQLDLDTVADTGRFGISESDTTLDGGAESGVLRLQCGRVFSVGSPRLIDLVPPSDAVGPADAASEVGVRLFAIDPEQGGEPSIVGNADPKEVLLGVDFNCESLLIFRIEVDDVGESGFRIDFEVAPAESTR